MFFEIEPTSLFPYQGVVTPLNGGEQVSQPPASTSLAEAFVDDRKEQRLVEQVSHGSMAADTDGQLAAAMPAVVAEVPRVGIGVFVIRPDGQFIIGRRNDSKTLGFGTFAVPGGHLEMNESFESCAHRELLEETGVDIPKAQFEFMAAVNTVFPEHGKHYVTIFMGAPAPFHTRPQLLEPEKCSGWLWTSWEEFKKQERELFEPLVKLIRQQPTLRPGSWILGAPARKLMLDL